MCPTCASGTHDENRPDVTGPRRSLRARSDTTLPATMRAAYVLGPGPAESIRYGELPLPEPGPTDYLVRVTSVAANLVDTFVRSGAYRTAMPTPFVVGRDLVGEVVAAGTGATAYSRGQQVWSNSLGHAGRQGSFSEYAVVPGDRLYAVPPDLDPTQLLAAAHPAASAWLALFRHGRLRYGDTVYVGGGAGNVGSAAVAFAAAAGARVIATARADDLDFVASLSATEVIDYASSDAVQRTDRAAPRGYDLYLDTSGVAEPGAAIDQLANGGRLVVMAGLHAAPTVPLGRLYTRDASIVGFAISNASVADLADAARGIVHLLHTTPWQPRIAEILDLSETARAHRLLDERQVKGRLVLRP